MYPSLLKDFIVNDYELRFYTFVNFYLSGIQNGIQTGHCSVRLVRKYTANGNPFNSEITDEKIHMVERWADSYETYIVLNGGDDENLNDIEQVVAKSGFPWANFIESKRALNNLRTCVGVVLPEYIFNAKRLPGFDDIFVYEKQTDDGVVDTRIIYDRTHPQYELIRTLKSCKLALT